MRHAASSMRPLQVQCDSYLRVCHNLSYIRIRIKHVHMYIFMIGMQVVVVHGVHGVHGVVIASGPMGHTHTMRAMANKAANEPD